MSRSVREGVRTTTTTLSYPSGRKKLAKCARRLVALRAAAASPASPTWTSRPPSRPRFVATRATLWPAANPRCRAVTAAPRHATPQPARRTHYKQPPSLGPLLPGVPTHPLQREDVKEGQGKRGGGSLKISSGAPGHGGRGGVGQRWQRHRGACCAGRALDPGRDPPLPLDVLQTKTVPAVPARQRAQWREPGAVQGAEVRGV